MSHHSLQNSYNKGGSRAASGSSSMASLAPHYNGAGSANPLGSTSNASGLRRSARNLKSVNEYIGGKVQQIFVLDDDDEEETNPDDEAPPSRPLAADLTNGNSHSAANQLARLNGSSGTSARGKRKAPASSPPPPPTATATPAAAASAPKKRRKEPSTAQQPQQPAPPPQVQRPAAPGSSAVYPPDYTHYDYAHGQPQQPPAWTAANAPPLAGSELAAYPTSYRGGYSGGSATVTTNGHTPRVGAMPDATTRKYYPPANTLSAANDASYLPEEEARRKQRKLDHQPIPAPAPPLQQLPVDDKDGHFIVREGDYISDPRNGEGRYKILSQLGQGTFGKVVECYDKLERRYVAIKVIRAVQKYRDASQIEIRVLRTLSNNDPHNENKCIHLLDTFSYRNHVCIVSELLGKSVFDFLKENSFSPFPPSHIWSFAKSLIKSVAFLHRLNLVHTDLKPENILLVNSEYDWLTISKRANGRRRKVLRDTDIRLIDFGSATFNEEYHSQVVSTRHYRAPEIILNMGWSFPCDAWSIGCILVEFYTGDALFQTHDNLEHLAMMEHVLGPMPDGFRRKAETFKAEYFRYGRLDYPNADTHKTSKKYVTGLKKLNDTISKTVAWKKHNERFLHLLRRLLDFDPNKRITMEQALEHPYFALQPNEIPP